MNCLICDDELTLTNKNFERCYTCDKEICRSCINNPYNPISVSCPFCKSSFHSNNGNYERLSREYNGINFGREKNCFRNTRIRMVCCIINLIYIPLNLVIIPLSLLGGSPTFLYVKPKREILCRE